MLINKIKSLFKVSHFVADKNSLVEWDGFDELEKKAALKFFKGKNSGQLLAQLRRGEPFYLEEWTVLRLEALSHYARAYFIYLLEELASDDPDEEFIFYLMGALYQIIYMNKGSPFSNEQTDLIKALVQLTITKSENESLFEYFGKDIHKSAKEFFDELKKYDR